MTIFNSILHVVSEKKTSSQEPLDGLEPYLAEMFLARSLSSVVTFCSDRPPFKMAAVTKNRNFLKNFTEKPGIYAKLLLGM
jgi:hypothetical protein